VLEQDWFLEICAALGIENFTWHLFLGTFFLSTKPAILPNPSAGVYLPEGRLPIIPIAERSGAKFFVDWNHI
jgi:hypothetical protein